MLLIDIRSIKPGHHEFSFDPEPEEVEVDADRFHDVHVDVRMDYDGTRVFVQATSSAIATLECDRTLVKFDQAVRGQYALLFAPADESADSDAEDARILASSAEEIDITDIVRDTLLLSIPVRKIAPGSEDADVPTAFGALSESEVDPRWEALKVLKERDGGNEIPG